MTLVSDTLASCHFQGEDAFCLFFGDVTATGDLFTTVETALPFPLAVELVAAASTRTATPSSIFLLFSAGGDISSV